METFKNEVSIIHKSHNIRGIWKRRGKSEKEAEFKRIVMGTHRMRIMKQNKYGEQGERRYRL